MEPHLRLELPARLVANAGLDYSGRRIRMASQQVRHPVFARVYARLGASMENAGVGKLREELLAGLTGAVIEVGAGSGLNFGHYPPSVSNVLAIEPEPHLRSIAEQAAGIARVPIKLVDSRAEQLPADDGSFDAVVATLMLCSVSDPGVVLAEMRRVLRPGGELAFMEHVRADTPGYRRIQQLADATIWPTCCGGCHASRDPVSAIEAAGFTIRDLTRYRLPDSRIPWPTAPHARGVAVRTEA
jgi:ubiquinone/menaquinone biosynthesis C-methylase UbiE